jgi:hypothetical protein
MAQHHIPTGGRYPVLRTVAILWLVSALLAFVGGIYQAFAALFDARGHELVLIGGGAMSSRIMAFFIWLAATFFVVILNIAVAELIKLAIDIEHNSRMAGLAGASSAEPVAARLGNGKGIDEESAETALIRGH